MTVTTSFRALHVLELLRTRCGMTAGECAKYLILTTDAAYSRMRRALNTGTGTLNADTDIKVQIAIQTISICTSCGVLPFTDTSKELGLLEVERIRRQVLLESIEAGDNDAFVKRLTAQSLGDLVDTGLALVTL